MLRAFAFDRLGVVVGDLYFRDPEPMKGQESPERGVRLELRVFNRGDLKGTIYSAQPIEVAEPIWRVDLLESLDGTPGSYDRTHHHPVFRGWDPSHRVFVRDLSLDSFGWLEAQLNDLPAVLKNAGFPADTASPEDEAGLRDSAKEIVAVTKNLLERVRAGELGRPPADAAAGAIRNGWL
jgi:hypothetical protein